MKSGEIWSRCFREDVERLKDFILVYSPSLGPQGQGQITLGDKISIVTERVCYFDHTL